jgi:hypothetical protein
MQQLLFSFVVITFVSRYLATNMEMQYTFMRETAVFKEDIKRSLRKLQL